MDDIIIDANALGHSFNSTPELSYNGMITQAIYHWVVMMRSLRNAFPDARITILWDGHARHRFEILPDYKGDRDRAEQSDPEVAQRRENYRKQVPIIKKATELLGLSQYLHPDYEADDLAGLMIRACPGRKVLLVTGDTDWLVYLAPNVEWYDPRQGGTRVSLDKLQAHTGFFTPGEYIEGKALQGDPTDSIPGIPKMGPKTAAEFLAKWKTVDAFFRAVDSGSYTPKVRKSKAATSKHPEEILASQEGRELFRKNMALMDLRTPHIRSLADLEVTKGAFDAEKFKLLCGRLGFVSVTRNFGEWISPFQGK